MSNDWISPKKYFECIVKPTVDEYLEDRRKHHKENAVFQLSSFSERYFKYHHGRGDGARIFEATDLADFRKKISDRWPEYGLLWHAANAVKHQFPDRYTPPSSIVTFATEVWESEEFIIKDRNTTIHEAIDIVYEFWRGLVSQEPD